MSGVFDFLDNLTTQAGAVAGRAVDVVGQLATANGNNAAKVPDQQEAARAATLSGNVSLGGNTLLWVGIGVVAVGVLYMALRRRG